MEALEKSDLFEGLSVVHLKLSGLWSGINHYRRTGRTSRIFHMYMLITIFYMFVYILFQVLCVFFISLDIKMATFIYVMGIIGSQVWFKVVMFYYNFGEQCLLIDLLKNDFLSSVPKNKLNKAKSIYREIGRMCNIFSVLAFTGSTLTIVFFLVLPGFSTDGTSTGRRKIVSGWYPVPYSKTPWYEIVFTYEVILFCWHGCLISLFECILLHPMMGLYGHFVLLGYLLTTLCDDGIEEELRKTQMKKILRDYDKLLWYADKFRSTNNAIITLILGCDIGTMILSILFMLFGLGDNLSAVKLMLLLFYTTVEICLVCVSSSIVETASSNIGYAFYSSSWFTADKTIITAGKIMMLRSRKPFTLTAVKMYPVNMETLINIFRFIYSTVAVLSKMK